MISLFSKEHLDRLQGAGTRRYEAIDRQRQGSTALRQFAPALSWQGSNNDLLQGGALALHDGANLYAVCSLGFDVDHKRLPELREEGPDSGILLHDLDRGSGILSYPAADRLAGLNGYSMVNKPIKEATDSQGRRKTMGSVDIDLAIDALEMADRSTTSCCSRRRRLPAPVDAVQRKACG
jgi:hypothetical protein